MISQSLSPYGVIKGIAGGIYFYRLQVGEFVGAGLGVSRNVESYFTIVERTVRRNNSAQADSQFVFRL